MDQFSGVQLGGIAIYEAERREGFDKTLAFLQLGVGVNAATCDRPVAYMGTPTPRRKQRLKYTEGNPLCAHLGCVSSPHSHLLR